MNILVIVVLSLALLLSLILNIGLLRSVAKNQESKAEIHSSDEACDRLKYPVDF
jgi:hypothetical protein